MAGQLPWVNTAVVTVAGSPLTSPWIDTSGFSQVTILYIFAGGTSVHTLEGSFDGVTADADLATTPGASPATITALPPYIRWKTVQTVADATKSKVVMKART